MLGTTVTLVKKTTTGFDEFGNPIESETLIDVDDVLVGNPSSDDLLNSVSLYGKQIHYVLGIPKSDTNDWEDSEIIIFGKRFRTVGFMETGIQANIPLRWRGNIKVSRIG